MNVMVKVNRALMKSGISVTQLNGGTTVAEKDFFFEIEGRRSAFTLRAVGCDSLDNPKVEVIVWETCRKVSGKSIELEEMKGLLPGFDPTNERFSRQIEKIRRKVERKMSPNSGELSFAERYPDENPEGFDESFEEGFDDGFSEAA